MITSTTFIPPFTIKKPVPHRRTEQSVALTANVIRFVAALPGQAHHRLRIWNARLDDRAYLAGLRQFQLSEMGMTLDQRDSEVNKPFWKE